MGINDAPVSLFTARKNNQDIQSLCDSVAQSHGFPNEDQRFWWRATAPSLDHLLANCGYSEEDQLAYLHWYHRFIIPALGPRPVPGKKALFEPCPVFDGSVCELSINWKELDPVRVVRFTIEAVGYQAGTATDPYNQEETKDLLRKMAKEVSGLDLKQFDIFVNELFLPSETAETLIPKLPGGTPLSQAWIAFDLMRGKLMVKVYFMPILKWIHTGIPTKTLVFDAARKCNGKYGTYDASIALLDSYLELFAPGEGPVIEMVAIDCIDSPNSRIKCYLRTGVNTLAKAKQTYTLGGRLLGEVIEAGLQALGELWPILFRLEGDNIENTEVFPSGSYCGCAVEMKPNHAEPETKIHIPVRKIAGTDAQLCESLSAWFKCRGHGEFAAAYKNDLAAAFPEHDLDATGGTHTFVSFTYTKKTGVYMTMYYSTKIFGVHLKDIWKGYDNLWEERGGLEYREASSSAAAPVTSFLTDGATLSIPPDLNNPDLAITNILPI